MMRMLASWCVVLGVLVSWGTAAGADVPAAVKTRQALSETFQYPGLDDPKATLTDVLDQVRKLTTSKTVKIQFDINEKAFRDDDAADVQKSEVANPALPPMDAPLEAVLRKILSRVPAKSGATFVIQRDGTIEITTEKAVRQEFYRSGVQEPVPPLVVADFEEKPLGEALRTLARQTRVNVVLDPRAGKDSFKVPVTAELINVPLDDAVRLLTDMAGLKSVYVGRVLYVTGEENALKLETEEKNRELELKGKAGPRRAPIRPVDPKKEKSVSSGDSPCK